MPCSLRRCEPGARAPVPSPEGEASFFSSGGREDTSRGSLGTWVRGGSVCQQWKPRSERSGTQSVHAATAKLVATPAGRCPAGCARPAKWPPPSPGRRIAEPCELARGA